MSTRTSLGEVEVKSVEQELSETLLPQGFHRKGGTWRKEQNSLAIEIQLQKSRWSPQAYLNFFIYFVGEDRSEYIASRVDEWISSGEQLESLIADSRNVGSGLGEVLRSELVTLVGKISPQFLLSAEGTHYLAGSILTKRVPNILEKLADR